MADEQQFADLVFEGGGVKGIGLAGAYAALEQRGVIRKNVAGTSAGAITAALVAVGYTAEELDRVLLDLPFAKFKDKGWEDRIPGVGRHVGVLRNLGIYEGKAFRDWMGGLLEERGITRFGQLVDEHAEDPANRWTLRVIASDVTQRRMLVLPNDAHRLGVDPDDMLVADAVRMSMSIPIFFEPVRHWNPKTRREHLIVDGGMLSNFPVWLFDCKDRDPRWPTFGLMLVEPQPAARSIAEPLPGEEREVGRGSLLDYVKSLAHTMMEAHDRLYIEKANYARTIAIPTIGVTTTEFDIDRGRIDALYESGHAAVGRFLDQWDFAAYIAEFRRGKEHSRRADLVRELEDAAPGMARASDENRQRPPSHEDRGRAAAAAVVARPDGQPQIRRWT
jgi:NTE family protein